MIPDLRGTWSACEIWEAALGELQIQVNKANFRTWLQPTVGLSYQDGQFIVGVPNTFVAEYLDRNQRSLIERTLAGITNCDIKIQFQVQPVRLPSSTSSSGRPKEHRSPGSQLSLPGLNSRYTFDTFIVGNNNRFAYAAAMEIAAKPGNELNPLFIYAGPGLGKTHLLHAIGHITQANNLQVLYATAERYTNEFVYSLRQRNTEEFHRKYRSVDILLMDDIDFIGGKEQTEGSFFHTFNELHNANHQIVIASNYPPKSIPLLESRLCSRFESGLAVEIQSPDLATRLAILQGKTKALEIELPTEVMEFIAQKSHQGIRELQGSLNRVLAYAQLVKAAPTIDIATQALAHVAPETSAARVTSPNEIIAAVALSFGITPADLIGRKRDKGTAFARQVAMYLLRQGTRYSLQQIGRELGGRDHSTVVHACEKITTSINSDSQLRCKIENIWQTIQSAQPKEHLP